MKADLKSHLSFDTMASSSPESSLLGGPTIQWGEQAVFIKDIASKFPVPNLVRIIKGQYRNIGVSKSVHTELYLHSVKTTRKVLADAIRIKDSGKNRIVASEQKYSLPVTYQGWFELLSEDGKSIRAIQSIQELAKFFPQTCLVRENIKAFIRQEGSDMSPDKVKVVQAGERLTLVGEVYQSFTSGKTTSKKRLLRCMDSKGDNVYFAYEQRGLFSPIAGQTNISGVHTLKGLLEKFRLPIMVRLVHGVIPTKMEKGFSGAFRLVSVYSDETAFVCPLKPEAKMVPISTREPLKLVTASNYSEMRNTEEVRFYHQRCIEMLTSYMNSIHILIAMPDPAAIAKGKEELLKSQQSRRTSNVSASSPSDTRSVTAFQPMDQSAVATQDQDVLFEEIDDIYQYVREGGMPPAPRVRKSSSGQELVLPRASSRSSLQHLALENDPTMETKMQQIDLPEEDYDLGIVKDSNYWEEPIYEPLEKIREMKRKNDMRKNLSQGDLGTLDSRASYDGNGAMTPHSGSGGEISPSSSKADLDKFPVANLRQVLKQNAPDVPTTTTISPTRPKSFNMGHTHAAEIEKAYNTVPPPIPPKMYGDQDIAPRDAANRHTYTPNSRQNTQGMSNVEKLRLIYSRDKTAPKPPGHTTGFDEVTPAIVATLEKSPTRTQVPTVHSPSANGVVSNAFSPPLHQISSNTPPGGSRTHPPHVAVARVGDYKREAMAVVNVNHNKYSSRNGRSNSNTNFDHAKQSMYL